MNSAQRLLQYPFNKIEFNVWGVKCVCLRKLRPGKNKTLTYVVKTPNVLQNVPYIKWGGNKPE